MHKELLLVVVAGSQIIYCYDCVEGSNVFGSVLVKNEAPTPVKICFKYMNVSFNCREERVS